MNRQLRIAGDAIASIEGIGFSHASGRCRRYGLGMRMLPLLLLACTAEPVEEPWDGTVRERCFEGVGDPAKGLPEYDVFEPTIGRHCAGTDHQDIAAVERLVFLGDSVTVGTPPTDPEDFYAELVSRALQDEWPGLQVDSCAEWGARGHHLMSDQIPRCFPEPTDQRTLVVMTLGGNDMSNAAQDISAGATVEEIMPDVEEWSNTFRTAIQWFREDEATRFPGGVDVVFANIYEFTDTTGDMDACPTAATFGVSGQAPEIRSAYVSINEHYVETAVLTGTDVVFSLEHFCGHGFKNEDPDNECYRGPGTERWFDGTCIHPTPEGHEALADLFLDVILDRVPE